MVSTTLRAVATTELRARFAARLSRLYASEVPLYETLVEVSQEVNERVPRRHGHSAERLGSIARATAERHGAIRLGTTAAGRWGSGSERSRLGASRSRQPVATSDLVREVDARVRDHPERVRQDVAAEVWSEGMPGSEDELCRRGLAFFTYALADATRRGTH